MRRKIYQTFLTIPVLLVLLHSVTPHHHIPLNEGVSFAASRQCPETLLSRIFQIDLGENHLEDFQASSYNTDFSIDHACLFAVANLDLFTSKEVLKGVFVVPGTFSLQSPFLEGSRSLRAPPAA